jgi:hypothetical protein
MNSLSGFRAISAKNMTERHFKIKSSRFLASFPKVLFHVRNINTNCIQVQYYLLKSLQKYNDDSEETFDLILLNRFLMSLSLTFGDQPRFLYRAETHEPAMASIGLRGVAG